MIDPTEQKHENSLFVIQPYWHAGTWVFDDPLRGLIKEPFVAGVPEILSELVQNIPAAQEGFRLTFSTQPFPGFQARFAKVESEYSGTWYQTEDGRRGWLCPALFKYYASAPEALFVRADGLS